MSAFQDWILALDFDGVIWDSVGECYVMARRAYQQMFGKDAGVDDSLFRAGRWLVRTGGDFLIVLELAQKLSIEQLQNYSKAEFQKLRVERAAELAKFEAIFYRVRNESREGNFAEWLSFQKPYERFIEQYPELIKDFGRVVLCTTKDESSARTLLESAHLNLPIWGREKGVNKGDQVRSLCQQFSQVPEHIVFIDDVLENLEQVRPCGCQGFLADWGYNTPAEQELARREGYGVLRLDDVRGQLDAWKATHARS